MTTPGCIFEIKMISMLKNTLLSISLILLIFISGCTSSHLNKSRIDESAFPPGFGDPQYTLLVEKRTGGINPKGISNYLEKSFKKNYSGKFEMAAENEIQSNARYQDKNIYRFVVKYDMTSNTTQAYVNGRFVNQTSYRIDLHLFDRLNDKSYPSLGVYSNVPAKAINRTSVLLNERLKK
jgi:hypothetical protein